MKTLSKILTAVIVLLLLAVPALAADSTMYQKKDCVGVYCVLRLSWTSSGTGTFDGFETMAVNGWIDAVETDPDDTAAPTVNYDIYIANKVVSSVNEDGTFTSRTTSRAICGDTGSWSGADITPMNDGVLANRHNASPEMTRFLDNSVYGGVMNLGPLLVDLANTGNTKKGMINIYFYKAD